MRTLTLNQPQNAERSPVDNTGLRPLVISGKQWRVPLAFMLSLALCGLKFYPAVFLILIFLVNAFRNNRYQFLVMFMLTFGAYGLTTINTFFIKGNDIILATSLVLLVVMYKTPLVRKLVWLWIGLVIGMFIIARFSVESIRIQFLSIRMYMTICCFIIPIAVFAGRHFDIRKLFKEVMPFALLMCTFYILDAVVFRGNILIPNSYIGDEESTFWSPVINLFSPSLFRKYPPGMIFVAFAFYPAIKYYRLTWKQWAIIIGGLLSTQTFTVLLAFLFTFFLAKGLGKYIFRSMIALIGIFALAYSIDSILPFTYSDDGTERSTLRIRSSINQFISLNNASDLEELSKFASGRMAQLIPNLELIASENKSLTGLGFLHPDYTQIPRYVIKNEYFTDISKNEVLAGGVEINPMQIFIYTGYAGLLLFYGFYALLCWMVRNLKYRGFFYYAFSINMIASLGNYATLSFIGSLLCMGFALGAVCLANRPPEADYPETDI